MLPSVILLISVFLAIHIVLPVGTYLLFAGRHDDKTRLWFFAIMILCFGMSLVIIRPFLPSFFGHEFPWFCTFLAWMVMIEVLRRERGLPKTNWIGPVLVLGAWITYQSFLYYFQLTASIGLSSQALSVVVLCSVLYWQVLKLCKHVDGKSLFLLKLSMMLYIIPNIVRVIEFIRTGNQEVMDVFKFSWSANLLSGSYVFAIMSLCFGYWGFTLEKLMRERNQAKFGQREAEADSEMMRKLLQERDQLLVNVLSNSLNQFSSSNVATPEMAIRLYAKLKNEVEGIAIEVIDNGGGFPTGLLEQLGQPWSSERPDGLGLALVLTKQLLAMWGGQLILTNRTDGVSGAVVRIWLRSPV